MSRSVAASILLSECYILVLASYLWHLHGWNITPDTVLCMGADNVNFTSLRTCVFHASLVPRLSHAWTKIEKKGESLGYFVTWETLRLIAWAIKTASHAWIYYNSVPVRVVLIWGYCIADSAIMLPRTTQQPHYSCSKIPESHQVLRETPRRSFHGLAEKWPNWTPKRPVSRFVWVVLDPYYSHRLPRHGYRRSPRS